MDRLYDNLGLTSAISRLGLAFSSDSEAALVQRHLRLIEAAMPAFNLDPAMAHLAAEIAAFEDNLPAAQRVALITLIVASMVALNEGSTRLPVTGPLALEPMTRILAPLCAAPDAPDSDSLAEISRTLDTITMMLDTGAASSVIARAPDEYRPLLYLAPYLYHQRIHAAEVRLAGDLRPRFATAAAASDREVAAALADVDARPQCLGALQIALSNSQRDAVRSAATRPLALISGGPGTGKTSIVLAIVRVLVRLGLKPADIALAAPTGKAAHRMGESLRDGLAQVRDPAAADRELIAAHVEPVTMHRLLGYSPRRDTFLHHRNNPLSATVVIVDETSMLDLSLMHRLAAALRPDARIVMLGDADQLPSVAAGAVFRDLVAAVCDTNRDADPAICIRLTHSYRMNPDEPAGCAIFNFAQSINRGAIENEHASALLDERSDPAALRFEGVELLSADGPALDGFLDRWHADRIRDPAIDALATKLYAHGEKGFDDHATAELLRVYRHLAGSRILCATRVFATGADRINDAMRRRAVASANRSSDRSRFLAGEPVMVVRNDYNRDLFNGDQGFIVRVARPEGGESPMAVFLSGDRFEPFHLAALGDALELCYATTIHKAQGSEFDSVAVVVPDQDLPMLTRELLYTAVSRARKSVVLVGRIAMIRTVAARKTTRYSGLADLLDPAARVYP